MTDRRTTIKWMLAAAAAMPLMEQGAWGQEVTAALAVAAGYGTDPNLTKIYHPGDMWPLTLSAAQRRAATALCNVIIPADEHSPNAASVGVVDFIDEWVSAPYPRQKSENPLLLEGLAWVDAEALLRFEKYFSELSETQQQAICDDIAYEPNAKPKFVQAAKFFSRYRELTISGFYFTPEGRRDIGYMGNVPVAKFDPPDPAVLARLGLTPS